MTLEQIRIFLAVAERQHVTRAAEALHLTQSAVSSAISALEARHQIRLFDRIGRRIVLTESGRAFIDTARTLVAQSEVTELALADLGKNARGRLRVAASQTVGSYWLPPYLGALHERHPDVAIKLDIGNTAEVAKAVEDGRADLGFVEGDVGQLDLQTRVVARDALLLVMGARHRLARKARITKDDYLAEDWLLREPGSGTRSALEKHLERMRLSVDALSVAMVLPSNEAILSALAGSNYVTFLSERTLSGRKTLTGLATRKVTWSAAPQRDFSVLIHPERYRTRAVEALLDLIKSRNS